MIEVVTCPTAIPAHASITPNVAEINYNTSLSYSCDLGYNRTDGDATRRCTELSTFDGTEANCTCTLNSDKLIDGLAYLTNTLFKR
jgi:hypothetical protein